ncbi:daf-6 [Cordylochernes scorpioides]|uniref:Daf-6 n=1 Tax=Cordylochernes scorpioides TaxID=51811 RepID=A0ABY6KG07_9ARAC|nr:daf-6 [Cordylochernes scorpioides]
MRLNHAERAVAALFSRLGSVVCRYPRWAIFLPIAVALLLMAGSLRIRRVDDPEYLFTPREGRGKAERRVAETLFPMNYSSRFDPSRETRVGRYGRIIVTTLDGSSILKPEVFKQLLLIDRIIHNITLLKDGLEWRYLHLCAKRNGHCWENEVLNLAKHLSAYQRGIYKIHFPFSTDPSSHQPILFGIYLGGVKLDNESCVTEATAVTLSYHLDYSDPKLAELVLEWENRFLEAIKNLDLPGLDIFRMTSHTMGQQIEESAREVTPYISVTIFLMFAVSVACCASTDNVRGKPLLGLAGCFSSNVAVGAAFGMCMLAGMEFITSCLGVFFIMLGIGMDDTFVLLAAWRRTDPSRSVEDRMKEAYRHAGVSITITSLTNLLSFSAGTATPFPSMQIFCTYAAVAVIFTYIFQQRCSPDWAVWCAGTPRWAIFLPIAIALLLMAGSLRIRRVDDPEYLFTPREGRGKAERRVAETLFPMNYSSRFDPSRETRVGRYGRIIVTTLDGSSILKPEVFKQLLLIDRTIHNITLLKDGLEWRYLHLCAKRNGHCWENEVLNLAKHLSAYQRGIYKIHFPFSTDPSSHQPILFGIYLGGVKLDNESCVTEATAVTLSYHLDYSDPKLAELVLEWENRFLEAIKNLDLPGLDIFRMTSHTMGQQIEESAREVTPYISVTIFLMFAVSVACCASTDNVRGKPLLGLAGCFSSNVAVGAAFGMCMLAGMEFITSCLGVFFIMLGIGMDDTFVLLAAWRRTDPSRSVEDRMKEAYRHAGVSITITSLTNLLSFSAGTATPFPSMQIFCTYAAVAVIFTYIFQVTFFGGCLALSGFAEHKNLHSITFKPVLTRQAAAHKGLLYRMLCAGGGSGSGGQHELMEWFRTYVGTALTRKPVKALVLVLFAVYLAVAGVGLSRMQEGLKISDLYSYDSYARAYVQAQYRYFNNYRFRIQILVNHTFDYSNPKDQGIVEDTLKRLEAGPFVASPMLTESWLRVYLWFLKEPKLYFARRSCNLETKEGFYRCLRNSFFKLPQARRFQNDVVFNDNYTDIIASRFIIQTHNWTSSDEIKQMILTFRGLVDDLPFQVTVFNQYFVFIDQYVVIRDYTTQSILATAILMNIITFLFIPKFTCAIWVGFSIVSIQIGLIGYSSLWGINLNAISMMTYVMCIGFSVDNAAHVTYAYVSVKKDNPNDKIKEALFWVGLPVVQGSATTIIGIIVLALAPAYVYVVIFKTVFLVMLFSALHSIFLLPVLLSLFDSFFSRKPSDVKTVPPPEREIMLASVEKTPAITNGF